jgi:hypothetical protein
VFCNSKTYFQVLMGPVKTFRWCGNVPQGVQDLCSALNTTESIRTMKGSQDHMYHWVPQGSSEPPRDLRHSGGHWVSRADPNLWWTVETSGVIRFYL